MDTKPLMVGNNQFVPPQGMQCFAGGFLFCGNKVALVRKSKPAWQFGKLNCIGGAIEGGESPRQAMRREFLEETKLDTMESDWTERLVLIAGDGSWCVYFFVAKWHETTTLFGTKEEPVAWYKFDPLPNDVIHNLRWIVPFMLDPDIHTPLYVLDKRGMDYGTNKE